MFFAQGGRIIRSCHALPLLAAAILFLPAGRGAAQEALRLSLAGDAAAESRHQAQSTIGYYNLLLGPAAWRFSSGLGLQYNDNIHLRQNNQEGDYILNPNLNAQVHWPVTEKNSVDFSLGTGYSAHLQHRDLNQLYITPGSGISFDIYAGDWVFKLHDRISITENNYENPGTGGSGNNATLQNAAGVDGLWDLNKIVLRLGYDHADYVSLTSAAGQPDSSSENFFFNGGVRVSPGIMAGLEAGGGLFSY